MRRGDACTEELRSLHSRRRAPPKPISCAITPMTQRSFLSRLPRKYSLKCPEMLGLRARREIGLSRLPDSAKGQTTPVPARDRLCGPECDDFVIVSKISPHPEVLTQTNLVIQSRPDSDSMDLRPIGASDGLTSFCGSSRRESC